MPFFCDKKSTVLNFLGGSSLGDLMHDVEFAILDTSGQETGPDNFSIIVPYIAKQIHAHFHNVSVFVGGFRT
jgi:hypothetical protein